MHARSGCEQQYNQRSIGGITFEVTIRWSSFAIFLKSWLILGCFRSSVLVKNSCKVLSAKVLRLAVQKMATRVSYDLCFLKIRSFPENLHNNRFFKTNRIDGRDFWGCYRQNSWHSRVTSDLDQSECCIVRTNANYLWLKRKLSALYCRWLPS